MENLDAFIGAQGGGRKTVGGRNGSVRHVTNFNNSGTGSFRQEISGNDPKMINFKVSGRVVTTGSIVQPGSNTSIFGQTSPNGFTLSGNRQFWVQRKTQVIIRHLYSRSGNWDRRPTHQWTELNAFSATYSSDVIVDKCSFSWANDEVANMYACKNGTIQYCIISEALHNSGQHSKGAHGYMVISGGRDVSIHHNLIMHGWIRFPLIGGFQLYTDPASGAQAGDFEEFFAPSDFINNVIYNWGARTGNGSSGSANIVKNLFIPGPAFGVNKFTTNTSFFQVQPNSENNFEQFYIDGNIIEGYSQFDADNWLNVRSNNTELTARVLEAKRETPFPTNSVYDFNHTPLEAYNDVLLKVGARTYEGRDSIDQRLISELIGRTYTDFNVTNTGFGIIDDHMDVGGWYTVDNPEPPFSTMDDGIPDAWKQSHGLDINVHYGLVGDIVDQPFSFDTDSMSPTYGYRWFEIYCMDIAGDLASITPPEEFTLTVTAGENGTVNTSGDDFAPSTSVFLQAFPASGFRLLRWERLIGDTWQAISPVSNPFNFLMPSQNTQVRALFTPISQGNKFFARNIEPIV
jgi:hypothetical protein